MSFTVYIIPFFHPSVKFSAFLCRLLHLFREITSCYAVKTTEFYLKTPNKSHRISCKIPKEADTFWQNRKKTEKYRNNSKESEESI